MPEHQTDFARWILEARGGSKEALGEALEACRCYLLLIANQEMDNALAAKGGASDIVQETFLEAHRDFARFRGTSEVELRAWLRQVLRNNVANFARHYRETDKRDIAKEVGLPREAGSGAMAGTAIPTATPTPSVRMMADEEAEALWQALRELPEDYRQVITLRHQNNKSFEEIAAIMGRSENAIRKLWFRAVEQLQDLLDVPT